MWWHSCWMPRNLLVWWEQKNSLAFTLAYGCILQCDCRLHAYEMLNSVYVDYIAGVDRWLGGVYSEGLW